MKFYACSQIGIGKSKNEDRMIIGQSVIAGGSFETEIESDSAFIFAELSVLRMF